MKNTLQTKRNKATSSAFRTLRAKTGRQRKVKAATTADAQTDLESDIPNVGIGRALLVILLLHVVAIAAIYTHFTLFDGQDEVSSAQSNSKVAVTTATPVAAAPAIAPVATPVLEAAVTQARIEPATLAGGAYSEKYIVVTGDTYSRIAEVRNVDLIALRALNDDRALRAGIVLDLPAELSSRPVAVNGSLPVAPVRARAAAQSTAPVAVMVKPRLNHTQASQAASAVTYSGQNYTVQSGDTLWRISKRYGVSREKLLRLNGISDATKLQIGAELKIPNQ